MSIKKSILNHKNVTKSFVAGLLLAFLFYKIDLPIFWGLLKSFDKRLLFPMVAVALLTRIFTAIGLQSFLAHLSYRVGLFDLVNAVNYSRLMALVMPGRSGDFSIIVFLKKHAVPLGASLAVTIFDKLISLSFFSLFAFIGTILFAPQMKVLIVFYVVVFILSAGLYIKFHGLIHAVVKRILLGKYVDYFSGFWVFCRSLVKSPSTLNINFICTLGKWGVSYCMTWLLFKFYGADITVFQVCCISGIISIIQLLPISISGLGVSQVSAIYLYNHLLFVPKEITASVVFLWLVVQYLFDIVFCGLSFVFSKYGIREE
ncbi:hypothetical protein GO013_12480 [Pseudodesulfovibrio sp. JC047]|uniref:lysylphosphatidylglycerol synthase transmembrane domain-containing protein n=1 Tax=Pseudodesulfovibrio sp. JC047 TaxID=2683199 RepID=UPI0013D79EB1|nr:lysylphosphatidylglycerol synthase transmembrane domain-containing protein [Pseudodesulfovibrio sp. JC047]NDV20227.1 hypothetical protein [Pseudodesulfovibrio sp. JC047]